MIYCRPTSRHLSQGNNQRCGTGVCVYFGLFYKSKIGDNLNAQQQGGDWGQSTRQKNRVFSTCSVVEDAQTPGPCVQGARWGPLAWHRGQPCPADKAACSYAPGV